MRTSDPPQTVHHHAVKVLDIYLRQQCIADACLARGYSAQRHTLSQQYQ